MVGDAAPSLRDRQHERARLDRLCADAKASHSGALVIRGEAGVGKSALLRYVADAAAADFAIVEVAGVESEMELAYAGLLQLCTPMLHALDALPEPQRSALGTAFGVSLGPPPDCFLVGLATLTLVAHVAEDRPLLCLVDDAQWLDDASAQVLGFVARRLAAESVAMIFAMRESRDERRFAAVPEMLVGGLPENDARAVLATVVRGRLDARVRDRIVAETGGNPLALLELPRGLSAAELAAGFGVPQTRGVRAQLEDNYVRRIRSLPAPTQELMLLAAADAVGESSTVWRAASRRGIALDASAAAADEQLLEIGARVSFRHPLVRSAVYSAASPSERRAAHAALADVTDPESDPDRRAWHRAHAAAGPDEEVASDLEACATRAQTRGGLAAAAALLERSAELTPEPELRVERRLAAAQSKVQAGAFGDARALLARAERETQRDFARARIDLLRGLISSSSHASGDAPLELLRAAKRLEPLDATLARETYLDAWGAALFAGHLASPGGDIVEVSRAARAASRPSEPSALSGELLDGLALVITDGRTAGAPHLRSAVHTLVTESVSVEEWLHWGVLISAAAVTLWDFESWNSVSSRQLDLAREVGGLALLSIALTGQGMIATWSGDFEGAAALVEEDEAIRQAIGTSNAPYGAMLLAAYQGRADRARSLIATTVAESTQSGEGLGVDLARWCGAILNNSVGSYDEALAFSSPANPDIPGLYISTWMLPERIEAAVRCRQPQTAEAALREFVDTANAGDSDWGLGIQARSGALLAEDDDAEALYREAIERLGRTPIRTELARAHLLFGEWLRRERRRVEAREQLRTAHEMFALMAADAFAERARLELVATGEHVQRRSDVSRTELTQREEHIVRLARDGRSNQEIATELFISARTVEWHLGRAFLKLGVTSRRELKDALPARAQSVPLA